MRFAQVISSAVDAFRKVKAKLTSSNIIDVRQIAPYGLDSAPIKGISSIYSETSLSGKGVIVGYVNPSNLAEAGEIRIYSTDANKVVKAAVYVKADGVIQITGDSIEILGNSDNAVRYTELETAFNTLKTDFNTFITTFNTHVHSGVTTGGGATGTTATPGSSSSADITGAKINEIKTP